MLGVVSQVFGVVAGLALVADPHLRDQRAELRLDHPVPRAGGVPAAGDGPAARRRRRWPARIPARAGGRDIDVRPMRSAPNDAVCRRRSSLWLLPAAASALTAPSSRSLEAGLARLPLSVPADHVSHPAYRSSGGTTRETSRPIVGGDSAIRSRSSGLASISSPKNPSRFARARPVSGAHRGHRCRREAVPVRRAGEPRGSGQGRCLRERDLRSGTTTGKRGRVRPARLQARESQLRHRPDAQRGSPGRAARRSRLQPEGRRRPGNAIHYYSLTRMPTEGSVTLDGERVRRSGRQLDGPRVRHDLSREIPAGLGLVLAAARGRDRPDDVPDAPALTARLDPQTSGTLVPVAGQPRRLGRRGLHADARASLDVAGQRRRVSGRMADPVAGREARSARSSPCSTRRSSSARGRASATGKAPSTSRARGTGSRFAAVAISR